MWENKITVKKGNLGESIVRRALEKKGYIVYKAITEKAHGFDFLAVKDKRVFVIAEVKSKARMNKFEATGIDVRHLNDYVTVMEQQNLKVVLFFVDEHPKEKRVYCQSLYELLIPCVVDGVEYPNYSIAKGIVLFPLSKMIEVEKLTDDESNTLTELSSRNYEYE
jgi:Holliday junction resolvase-like predicted endonuclease